MKNWRFYFYFSAEFEKWPDPKIKSSEEIKLWHFQCIYGASVQYSSVCFVNRWRRSRPELIWVNDQLYIWLYSLLQNIIIISSARFPQAPTMLRIFGMISNYQWIQTNAYFIRILTLFGPLWPQLEEIQNGGRHVTASRPCLRLS